MKNQKKTTTFSLTVSSIEYIEKGSKKLNMTKSGYIDHLIASNEQIIFREPQILFGKIFYPVHMDNEELRDFVSTYANNVGSSSAMRFSVRKSYDDKGLEFKFEEGYWDAKKDTFVKERVNTLLLNPNWKVVEYFDHWKKAGNGAECCEELKVNKSCVEDILLKRKQRGNVGFEVNPFFPEDEWKLIMQSKIDDYLDE